jgi:hypothetical protein
MLKKPEAALQTAHTLLFAMVEITVIPGTSTRIVCTRISVILSATSHRRGKEEWKQKGLLTYFPPFLRLENLLKIKYPEGRQ